MTRSLAVLLLVAGCNNAPSPAPARIIDLSTSTDELRLDFDAHRGEARFVTLLSPT